jgi:hypothetical protein
MCPRNSRVRRVPATLCLLGRAASAWSKSAALAGVECSGLDVPGERPYQLLTFACTPGGIAKRPRVCRKAVDVSTAV